MIFQPSTEEQINFAVTQAYKEKLEIIDLEQLLLALTYEEGAEKALTACGCKVESLRKKLESFIEKNALKLPNVEQDWAPKFSIGVERLLQRTWLGIVGSGRSEVKATDLIIHLYSETDSHALYFLKDESNVKRIDLLDYVSHSLTQDHEEIHQDEDWDAEESEEDLFQYLIEMNAQAKAFHPLVGRTNELERIIQVLTRKDKNNPLLVGEPGVGKTAIVRGFVQEIENNKTPKHLQNIKVFQFDIGSLVAGAKYRGEFESRFKAVEKYLKSLNKRVILFIDDLHTAISAGNSQAQQGTADVSGLLKPMLDDAFISCIAVSSHKELKNGFDKDRALARRFQKIEIKEPSTEDCFEILNVLQQIYGEFHGVEFDKESLESIVKLSQRYITGKNLPDKAIDILDEVGAHIRLKNLKSKSKKIKVKLSDIEDVVARVSQIPSQNVTKDDKSKLKELKNNLSNKIFGQQEAVDRLTAAIKFVRAGLDRQNKPNGAFLFAGPTGVGKTELARQLAEELGCDFQRFDMSEYLEKHSVSRLVGAPPGYVGFEEGGLLTEAIHKSPYSVILMDEIEKAHPDLINILLQIMDDGSITDTNGKNVDCQNIVLIMTTNAGARDMARSGLGIIRPEARGYDEEQIKKSFSPEFLNRLDAIIPFKNLTKEILLQVVDKFLLELKNQFAEKNVNLSYDKSAATFILEQSYQPEYGARPIQRKINELVKTPLVDELLFGKLEKGGKVDVKCKNQQLVFDF